MRIAFLSQEFPPYGPAGGIGSYVSVIAPALARRGHDVHVIVSHDGEEKDLLQEGVELHLRPRRSVPLLERISRLSQTNQRLAAARSATGALRDLGDCDVIESPEWMAEALYVRKKERDKLVIHLHTSIGLIARFGGYGGRDVKLADALEIASLRGAAAITSPSQLLLDVMGDRMAKARAKKAVVRLPIDLSGWSADHTTASGRVIAVIGRLEHRKGIDVLIEAMTHLPEPLRDTTLIAVGRSSGTRAGVPYGQFLEQLAEKLDVQFQQRPHLSREEIADLYPRVRVLAVPSRFESFSVAALEAMASGVPVVCSAMCGVAEVLAGTEAGAVVPAENPVALMEALKVYLADADEARRAGRAARVLVEKTCSADLIAAQREEVYASVASRGVGVADG